jgi:hypothetical protein
VTGVPKTVPHTPAATVVWVRTSVVVAPELVSIPTAVTLRAIEFAPLVEEDPAVVAATAFTVTAPADGAVVSSRTVVVSVDGVPKALVVVRTYR